MYTAFYITNNKEISASNIASRKEYIEKYLGKLYCPTTECNAQLDYVELTHSKYNKIFRTHKGSEHIPTCPYCITHNASNTPNFSSETFSQAISDEHIRAVLKGLYDRNTEQSPSSAPAPKRGSTSHRKSDTQSSATGRAIASIDPDAEPVSIGQREPSVRKRRSKDILLEDNNKLRGIDGVVDSAYIGTDYVEFKFSSTEMPVSLTFYNAFRDKSQRAYDYVVELANLLITTKLKILVCCLGVIEIKNETASIQIMSPNHITIEGLPIYSYMALKAS